MLFMGGVLDKERWTMFCRILDGFVVCEILGAFVELSEACNMPEMKPPGPQLSRAVCYVTHTKRQDMQI